MPCVLPSYSFQQSCHNILDDYGPLQYEQLCVQFSHCPLPQGFFCCLAVQFLQNLPENWQPPLQPTKQKHHTYSNLISFHTSDTGHSVSFIDRVGYLEEQIRHIRQLPPVHYHIWVILFAALKEVCSHLQYDSDLLQFGFLCSCSDKCANHLAILPKQLDSLPQWIQCYYSKMELTASHLVWLQVKFLWYFIWCFWIDL